MDLSSLHWGSPLGLAFFFAGLGIWFWGFFNGIAALQRVKLLERSGEPANYGFPVARVERTSAGDSTPK